jgi:TonB family protein
MLTILLESRAHQTRYSHFMVASATVHAAILFSAVSATAINVAAKQDQDDPVVIHWVPMPKPLPATRVPIPSGPARLVSTLPVREFRFPIEIPTSLPSIDLDAAVEPLEFARGPSGNPGESDGSPSGSSAGDGRRAYDVSEVETAVIPIGNTIPDYPAALRASGIEGKVTAEFVVMESGRADPQSLRIVSATNDAFVDAIRRALSRMRFRPARIGDRAVAQLVQQQFVFRLDR